MKWAVLRKILSKWRIESAYTVLELDGELPLKKYSEYLIDGKEYKPVSIYGLPKHIAVKEDEDFVGKVEMKSGRNKHISLSATCLSKI